jgi:hypothetical protein
MARPNQARLHVQLSKLKHMLDRNLVLPLEPLVSQVHSLDSDEFSTHMGMEWEVWK